METSMDPFGAEKMKTYVAEHTSIGESCGAFLDSTNINIILRDK